MQAHRLLWVAGIRVRRLEAAAAGAVPARPQLQQAVGRFLWLPREAVVRRQRGRLDRPIGVVVVAGRDRAGVVEHAAHGAEAVTAVPGAGGAPALAAQLLPP